MNYKSILTSLLSLTVLWGCSQPSTQAFVTGDVQASAAKVVHTIQGDVRYHTLTTKLLKSPQRDIVVYLPPSYKKNTQKKYPVFYFHDGQNIFDKATGAFGKEWYIDEKTEFLIQKKVIEEIIIVGVYNGLGERINELTWNRMPEENAGGDGKNYCDFLTNEVKPFVDKTYRTKPEKDNTAVAGSSLGGLISFYLARYYSDTFSKVAMMSPSFWWNNGEALDEVGKMNGKFDFWIDGGTKEGSNPQTMVNYVNSMYKKLSGKFGQEHIFEYIQPGAEHNEEAWATRIHGPLIEFFGTEKDTSKKMALIKRLMNLDEWDKL